MIYGKARLGGAQGPSLLARWGIGLLASTYVCATGFVLFLCFLGIGD